MGWFKRNFIRCLGVFCLGFGLAVSASDFEKEGRWAEEVVDQLFDGEPVWLLTDTVRFLSLHVVPESGHGGGLLICMAEVCIPTGHRWSTPYASHWQRLAGTLCRCSCLC